MKRYDKHFKEEAVKLSYENGVKKAASQLGIPYYTLVDWRRKQQKHGDQAHIGSGKAYPQEGKTQREMELEKDNAELRRANEILKDALYFFAKDREK